MIQARVLVVNNDIEIMQLLQQLLTRRNYLVEYSSDKNQMLELIARFAPHIIIVDILQKEVILCLKSNPNFKSIPIIVMTGHAHRDFQIELIADDCIQKPFHFIHLEQKLLRLLNR